MIDLAIIRVRLSKGNAKSDTTLDSIKPIRSATYSRSQRPYFVAERRRNSEIKRDRA
jgi:hypothetical protein